MRQSMPSSNIVNCEADMLTLPSLAADQTNRLFSSRLLNGHAPSCAILARTGGVNMAHPPDNLDQIAPATTKDEQMPGAGIFGQHLPGLRSRCIEPAPHVRDTRRQPDPPVRRNRDQTINPCTSNYWASSLTVFSPLMAASATLALQRVDSYLLHKAPANDLNTGSLLAPIKVDAL